MHEESDRANQFDLNSLVFSVLLNGNSKMFIINARKLIILSKLLKKLIFRIHKLNVLFYNSKKERSRV